MIIIHRIKKFEEVVQTMGKEQQRLIKTNAWLATPQEWIKINIDSSL